MTTGKEPSKWGKAGAHLFFNGTFFFEPVVQDFIFKGTCVAHGALLNFGNCGGIFHDLDHSYRRTHRVWCELGPSAWPSGGTAMSLLNGGQRAFSNRGLCSRCYGFLKGKRANRRKWKLCGTCFQYPWMTREVGFERQWVKAFICWAYPSTLGNLCLFIS